MATTNRPSPATKNAAFAVLLLGISRKVERASIVVAPGVSTSSIGRAASTGGSGFRVEALEGPLVGRVLVPVADVEPGVVEVAAVRVLHDELADADQAAT